MRLDPDVQLVLVVIGGIAAVITIWGWLSRRVR